MKSDKIKYDRYHIGTQEVNSDEEVLSKEKAQKEIHAEKRVSKNSSSNGSKSKSKSSSSNGSASDPDGDASNSCSSESDANYSKFFKSVD